MPALLAYYDPDGTLADPLAFIVSQGDVSATREVWLWNDRGGLGGATAARNVRVQLQVDPGSGYVSSGEPILDERWGRIRIAGVDNTGDPAFLGRSTGFVPIGTGAELFLGELPPDCAYKLEIYIDMPGGAASFSGGIDLVPIADRQSSPLAAKLTVALGGGVYAGRLDRGVRRLLSGGDLTADGTDTVVAEQRSTTWDGTERRNVEDAETFDQLDGAAAALAPGEEYAVTVSEAESGTVTWTRGAKSGGTATPPALPAGQILLGRLTVRYSAGATEIDTNDVDVSGVVRGEYLVEAGVGLTARISPGEGQSVSDTHVFSSGVVEAALAPNDTNRVWLLADGSIEVTQTSARPFSDAELLAELETDGSDVLDTVDRRTILARAQLDYPIVLRYPGSVEAVIDDYAWEPVPFDAVLHRWTLDVAAIGTSTGGAVTVDVLLRDPGESMDAAGTTIFTSFATADYRPSIAHDAVVLRDSGDQHEVVYFDAGERISASIVAVPDDLDIYDPPRDVVLTLFFRRV